MDAELLIRQNGIKSNLRMLIIQIVRLDIPSKKFNQIKKYLNEIEVEINKVQSFLKMFNKKCLVDKNVKKILYYYHM